MNRIDLVFNNLKKTNKRAFIAYITAGDPEISYTLDIISKFSDIGVDIIELGVPFSDPVGDGPVNQAAAERALKSGTNLIKIFDMIKTFRTKYQTPIVLFSYLNPIMQFGTDKFIKYCNSFGVDGVLTVDGPYDMCEKLNINLLKKDIYSIYLASPTTKESRIKEIVKHSNGFIYYVSSLGVTGERTKFDLDLSKRVNMIKKITKKPVCVGFGISTPSDAKKIAKFSDGIIIGSAFVKIIAENAHNKDLLISKISHFTESVVKELAN